MVGLVFEKKGRKDVICKKNQQRWLAYIVNSLKYIKKKLDRSAENGYNGS
jgi:hypothetical protein